MENLPLSTANADLLPFAPAWWAPGGDLQTILAYLLPGLRVQPGAILHQVAVTADERVVLCEDRPATATPRGMVLLLHGLGGHADSGYMLRVAAKLVHDQWVVFRLNHRGAGAGRGLACSLYHAGRSEDLAAVCRYLHARHPDLPLVAVGFSLSGNMLLKYLAEQGRALPASLCGALALCPPVDLALSAQAISRSRNRMYDLRFVRLLKQAVREREDDFPDFPPIEWPTGMSLRQFDEQVTAPRGGFASAADYYRRCSARPLLADIAVPTVIIAADDDPFVPRVSFSGLPALPNLRLELTRGGGHMGFLPARPTRWGDHRWMDAAICRHAMVFRHSAQGAPALPSEPRKQCGRCSAPG